MLLRAAKQHSSAPKKLQQALFTSTAIEALRLQWNEAFARTSTSSRQSSNICSHSSSTSQHLDHTATLLPSRHSQQSPQHQELHMTTGKPYPPRMPSMNGPMMHKQQQQQQQQPAGAAGRGTSPSSSTSDVSGCCKPDGHQPAGCSHGPSSSSSIKSAKRKAAEALLAARYSFAGVSSGLHSPAATAAVGPILSFAARAAAACDGSGIAAAAVAATAAAGLQLPQSKRQKSSLSLTAVIDRLESSSGNGSRGSTSSSSSPTAASTLATAMLQPQVSQLDKLQQSLDRLQGATRQMQQQEQQQAQQIREQQEREQQQQQVGTSSQQQQEQQQQEQPNSKKQRLDPAVAEAQRQHQQQQLQLLGQRLQQQHVVVQACGADCSHSLEEGWCHTQVSVPHVDWARVLDVDLSGQPGFRIAKGYEQLTLPNGLQVLVVENQVHLGAALQQLRASMQDPYIAIDLEWRPEFGRRFTPVALMQLASSTVAVLIRTCRMQYRLPPVLKAFLQDPSITLLGFGWTSSDEPKMTSTFGLGRRDFGTFMDLQVVAQGLGYCGFGLARLTRHVLGLNLPKSKKISISNWEAAALSRQQVKYAALDVLVAGQVFRALRLWHSSPSLCEVCHYTLGSGDGAAGSYRCTCGKDFRDIRGYLQHCERAGHTAKWAECGGCGCSRRLPWPSGIVPSGGGLVADGGGSCDDTGDGAEEGAQGSEADCGDGGLGSPDAIKA